MDPCEGYISPEHRVPGTPLNVILRQLNLKEEITRGDGHCTLHAVTRSFASQLMCETFSSEELNRLIRDEVVEHQEFYSLFISTSWDIFLSQLDRYISERVYNSAAGDFICTIIAAIYKRPIVIIRLRAPSPPAPRAIEALRVAYVPEHARNGGAQRSPVFVMWYAEHFSSLVRESPLLNLGNSGKFIFM